MKQLEAGNGKPHRHKACPNSPNGFHYMGSATLEWDDGKYTIWMNCYFCGTSIQTRSFSSQRDWIVSDREKLLTGR